MAKGMTKKLCIAVEKMVIEELTKVLGPHNPDVDWAMEWNMPYGETGNLRFHLICDSQDVGHVYRSSWLAARLDDPSLVGEDGYTKPRDQIEGGWPFPFTYPSGKHNLHFGKDMVDNRRDLASYLYTIAPHGSREKQAFGEIRFEVQQ